MTFAQRQNRLTTHFSERIPVVKRRISVCMKHGEGTLVNPFSACTLDSILWLYG